MYKWHIGSPVISCQYEKVRKKSPPACWDNKESRCMKLFQKLKNIKQNSFGWIYHIGKGMLYIIFYCLLSRMSFLIANVELTKSNHGIHFLKRYLKQKITFLVPKRFAIFAIFRRGRRISGKLQNFGKKQFLKLKNKVFYLTPCFFRNSWSKI